MSRRDRTEPAALPEVHGFGLHELEARSGVPARTVRYYQSEGLLPKPDKVGREARYGEEHLERLRTIAELRDRGLTLGAIRDLVAEDRPTRTVAEWLGIDATLASPWSDDRPAVVTRDELAARVGDRAPGLVAALLDADFIEPLDAGAWLVPSPALLDLALALDVAGVDVELTGQLRDLLRRRLAKAADDAVSLLRKRAGEGFAGRGSAEELARAVGALRPIAREMTSLILAQEVERSLRKVLEEGPAKLRKRTRADARH